VRRTISAPKTFVSTTAGGRVEWADEESAAEAAYARTVVPETERLDDAIAQLGERRGGLDRARRDRNAWLADHPEATRRLQALDRELNPIPDVPELIRDLGRTHAAGHHHAAGVQPPSHGIELDFGP
jgi:hypothetical protein